MSNICEVDQRHNEHPYEINKVPVQSGGFHVARRQFIPRIHSTDNQHADDAADDVKKVKTRDAENVWPNSPELKSNATAKKLEPLTNVQRREDDAKER